MGARILSDRPRVPEERPVVLAVNGKRCGTFYCTPADLPDLATGSLFSRGLIDGIGDIRRIDVPPASGEQLFLSIDVELNRQTPDREFSFESICDPARREVGALEDVPDPRDVSSPMVYPLAELGRLAGTMFAQAELYRKTGGVHCAGIARSGELLLIREDVGRHNAVDKVIGAALREGIDPASCVLLLSGRISALMLLKALRAEIPLLVTRHVPTALALDAAERRGITVVGRIGSGNPQVYAHPRRVAAPRPPRPE